MISLFLNAIDRAIDLLRSRAESDRRYFSDHIEPLFQEISRIHDDYIALVAEVGEILERDPPSEAEDHIRCRREELLPLREKVMALERAVETVDHLPEEALRFFNAVADYFSLTAGLRGKVSRDRVDWSIPVTPATTILEILRYAQELGWFGQRRLVQDVVSVRGSIEDRWNDLLQAYAAARFSMLR